MNPAFETLVTVCERMRHLTGTLETIRGLLLAEALGEAGREMPVTDRRHARGLYLHALALRQLTVKDLSATVQALAVQAEGADATQPAPEGAELLSLCRELSVSLRAVDAALDQFRSHMDAWGD